MSPQAVLSHPTVERVGWTLIHFLWQGALLAAMFGVGLALLRKSKANLRYLAGCLTLALMVLAPCLTMFMVPVSESGFAVESDAMVSMPAETSIAEFAVTAEVSAPEGPHPEPAPSIEVARPDVAVTPAHWWKERAAVLMEPALPFVVLGWLLGVFGLSVWHLGGWAQLQRLRRRMIRSVEPDLHSKLKELAELLGVRRAVALMESALVQVPTVVGWLKPVILLPASALTGLTREQLEAILAHELAHIRRFDYLVNMLQTAVEILGFYHPAVWWVSRKIRVERENCCDDLAIGVTGDTVRYAKALTLLEEMRGSRTGLAVAAGGGNLLGRIRRLVGRASREEGRYSWLPAAITALLILAIAVPTTIALNVGRDKQQEDPTASAQESSVGPAQDANSTEGDIPERFLNLDVTEEGIALEGKTVTWDGIVPLLGRVRYPHRTGLHLVASDDVGPEELHDVSMRVSQLSRQLGLGYLSGVGSEPVEPNDFPKEYFYSGPLEFGKEISIDQRAESGGFRQTYYRKGLQRVEDPTGAHTERATLTISKIHFEKSLWSGKVTAKLDVMCNSWPVSKFEVGVRLLDNKGKGLSEASCALGGDGSIISGELFTFLGGPTLSLGQWSDVSTATAFEIFVAPMPDVPADVEALPPSQLEFGATLSNGVTVELVGVSEHPSYGEEWWRPDGEPLGYRPYEVAEGFMYSKTQQQRRELAFRLTNLAYDDAELDIELGCCCCGTAGAIGHTFVSDQRLEDFWAGAIVADANLEVVDACVGIASGPWRTIAECDGRGRASYSTESPNVRFGDVTEKKGRTYLPVRYNTARESLRVIALSKSGDIIHQALISDAHMGQGKWLNYLCIFDQKPSKIKKFKFQMRPYEWVQFRNISLKPGRETDVAVAVMPPGGKPAGAGDESMVMFTRTGDSPDSPLGRAAEYM
ncbi:MAG: M56 family metallopeptidase, partial [Planctomycetota bacterium]